jgi:hypothetical protein
MATILEPRASHWKDCQSLAKVQEWKMDILEM